MARGRLKKIIQIPIDEELLEQIDETSRVLAESRAAFIREACRLRLRSLEGSKLDRIYVEGYQRMPENTAWAKVGAELLSRRLPKEKW
jgi:metal-responsive CopG/Arc/MetJ family transcriptional regulator